MNLCLFDLDDTLLPMDSDHAWGEFLVRQQWVDAESFTRGVNVFFEQYKAAQLDIHAYIAFVTQPLRQRGAIELEQARQQFMAEVILPQVKPQALNLVAQHQRQGDFVVLVTATNDFVTTPIAQALGIDNLIAVQLERDSTGAITGRIAGVPSYRQGKVTRVTERLALDGLSWNSFERITVYSDSPNDLPLLERATDPVVTNPTPALKAIAVERGWRELYLFA